MGVVYNIGCNMKKKEEEKKMIWSFYPGDDV